jgi:hypothetical protein
MHVVVLIRSCRAGYPISPNFNLTATFCKLLLRRAASVTLSDLAQEHPDIHENLAQLQSKLPEEIDAYLDQFEAATDIRMQFTTVGRLAQTYEALRFLDE